MARIRSIKPDFWTDEKIVELEPFSRLLFIGLWNFADDEGRMVCSPKRIKMQILPADSAEIPRLLGDLERAGLIQRYVVEGIEYLQVCNFTKHQKVDKRHPSKLPPPPVQSSPSRRIPPNAADGMEWNGMERTTPALEIETTGPASEPAAGVVPAEAGQGNPNPGPETPPDDPPTPPPTPPVRPKPAPQADPGPRPIAEALSLDAMRVAPAVGTDDHSASGALWAVLAANSCKGTASHPSVVEMARAGVTVQELRQAIAEARKSNSGTLNPAYLAAIVERFREAPAKRDTGKGAAWATDDHALEAKARELGMWPTKAPTYAELRNLIRAKLNASALEAVR